MFCVNCFHKSTSVTNSRPSKKQPQVWRRRLCQKCGTTFTTYERPSLADNKPVLTGPRKSELFNLGRLTISIANAFTHDPEEAKHSALSLAQTVEDILSSERKSITPGDIEAVTHNVLKNFDELAAMQYAMQRGLISSTKRRGRSSLAWRGPRTDA